MWRQKGRPKCNLNQFNVLHVRIKRGGGGAGIQLQFTVVVTDRRMDRQIIFNVQLLLQSGGTKLFSYVSSCDKTSFQLCESLNLCTEKFP